MTHENTSPISLQAFRSLTQAYGSDPQRWPLEARAGGLAFAETMEGQSLVEVAGQLDAALLHYDVPPPSAEFASRILAPGIERMALRRRLRRWAISAGLIGVGLAGGLTGATVVMVVTPPPSFSMSATVTAFGELQADGDIPQDIP